MWEILWEYVNILYFNKHLLCDFGIYWYDSFLNQLFPWWLYIGGFLILICILCLFYVYYSLCLVLSPYISLASLQTNKFFIFNFIIHYHYSFWCWNYPQFSFNMAFMSFWLASINHWAPLCFMTQWNVPGSFCTLFAQIRNHYFVKKTDRGTAFRSKI